MFVPSLCAARSCKHSLLRSWHYWVRQFVQRSEPSHSRGSGEHDSLTSYSYPSRRTSSANSDAASSSSSCTTLALQSPPGLRKPRVQSESCGSDGFSIPRHVSRQQPAVPGLPDLVLENAFTRLNVDDELPTPSDEYKYRKRSDRSWLVTLSLYSLAFSIHLLNSFLFVFDTS